MSSELRAARWWAAILAAAWLAAGCAKHPSKLAPAPDLPESFPMPTPPPSPELTTAEPAGGPAGPSADECVLLPVPADKLDTATVALPGPYDVAAAPNARSDAERFTFRLLFETLIRLDCQGRVRPALAESWTRSSDGVTWTFTLRPQSSGYNRGTLDARDVADWWLADSARAFRSQLAAIAAVSATDAHTLVVRLMQPAESVPIVLADPAFAAGRTRPRHSVLALSQMLFDPRDALALGADVIFTDDREAISYAARADSFASLPLPWSRTVALVLTSPADSAAAAAVSTPEFRESLTHEVRVDARPTERSQWSHLTCGTQPVSYTPTSRTGAARIGYSLGDHTARKIAARIAALGLLGPGATAVALLPQELATSLATGRERAYVVTLPAVSLVPCADRPTLPAGAHLLPLVDTRYQIILSPRAPALTVDWDGAVRLAEPVVDTLRTVK
jgi:hypothetical protein